MISLNDYANTNDEDELKRQEQILDEMNLFKAELNYQIPESNEKIKLKLHHVENEEIIRDSNIKSRYAYVNENGRVTYRIIEYYEPNSTGNYYSVESNKGNDVFEPGLNDETKIPYNLINTINASGRVRMVKIKLNL